MITADALPSCSFPVKRPPWNTPGAVWWHEAVAAGPRSLCVPGVFLLLTERHGEEGDSVTRNQNSRQPALPPLGQHALVPRGRRCPRGQGVEPRTGRDQMGARRRPNSRAQKRQSALDGDFTVSTRWNSAEKSRRRLKNRQRF